MKGRTRPPRVFSDQEVGPDAPGNESDTRRVAFCDQYRIAEARQVVVSTNADSQSVVG